MNTPSGSSTSGSRVPTTGSGKITSKTNKQTNMFNELKETQIKYSIKTVRQFKGHTGPCSAVITSSPATGCSPASASENEMGQWVMSHGSPFLNGSRRSWVTASDPLTHDNEITAKVRIACKFKYTTYRLTVWLSSLLTAHQHMKRHFVPWTAQIAYSSAKKDFTPTFKTLKKQIIVPHATGVPVQGTQYCLFICIFDFRFF